MNYKISYHQAHKHFINIEIQIEKIESELIHLQIPAWRPGRYELQNYAKNFQKLEAFNSRGEALHHKKITRNSWEITTPDKEDITIKYNCYCYQMDAGGAWLDEDQLYLNLIYCLMYVVGREKEACTLLLDIPDNYKVACGLPQKGKMLFAKNYFQLMDSPLIASPYLISQTYKVNEIPFHIWIEGDVAPEWEKIISDFKKFTQESIDLFGDFPENDYHFLFEILPYRNYHGVEHSNSTIIVLGPAENFNSLPFYENFLGISCHELFHAWNALKIRPKEMMPYDLSKENYFRTGFVIEGITTYYGDYLLARSGVFTCDQFFKELNNQFDKYFENFGRHNLSVANSSFDLWVDGYSQGIPNRKVSIYTSGALAALLLDLHIRKSTNNIKCLDDVMQILWSDYGKKEIGYSEEDYQAIVEGIIGHSMQSYFENYIYGITCIEFELKRALGYVGCDLSRIAATKNHERLYGFHCVKRDGRLIIDIIEPNSPADAQLSKDDEILAINNQPIEGSIDDLVTEEGEIGLTLMRFGKVINRKISTDGKNYLNQHRITKNENATTEEKENFFKWLKMTH